MALLDLQEMEEPEDSGGLANGSHGSRNCSKTSFIICL